MYTLDSLKNSVYHEIKALQGVDRIKRACAILQQNSPVEVINSQYGTTKEITKLTINPNLEFLIIKGFGGKYEIGMFSGDRSIVAVSYIGVDEHSVIPMLSGSFGVKLKDLTDPSWETSVYEKVHGNRCYAEFKNISNLCILISGLLGVEKFTLGDQASAACLLSESTTPTSVYISVLRLFVGKPSLYEMIGFQPLFQAQLEAELKKVRTFTYRDLVNLDKPDYVYQWALDLPLAEIISTYLAKKALPEHDNAETCSIVGQIATILNKLVYYKNSNYIRSVDEVDINTIISTLQRCNVPAK